MKIFKKNNQTVGVCEERYIYLVEVYKQTKRSFAIQNKFYIATKKPIKFNKNLWSTKDKDSTEWITRDFTLCFAPEEYLKKEGYYEL